MPTREPFANPSPLASRPIRSAGAFFAAVASLLTLTASAFAADEATDAVTARRFLESYCIGCHDQGYAEGDRDFSQITLPLAGESDLIAVDEIIDQVTLHAMPPEDGDQPTADERLAVLAALRSGIDAARERIDSTGGRTVMRRLSTREYENTLQTLLGRRVDTLGLTADFPRENVSEHMDNIGASLVTSGFLLDQYFQAADRLVEQRLNIPPTPPQDWHFTDHFVQFEELQGSHRTVFDYEVLCLYEQPDTETRQGGYGHIEDFLEGVPVSGLYDIRVLASAKHRDTHYDQSIFRIDLSEPFRLAIVTGDASKGHIHYPQAIEPVIGPPQVVPDTEPEWMTYRVWLEAGQTPRFIFPNGPYESRRSVIELNKKYADEFEKPAVGVSRTQLLRHGKLPRIQIEEVKIHGPIAEPGGPVEERAVFGDGGFDPNRAMDQLAAFAERAYRRPLDAADRERLDRIYRLRLGEGATERQAALDTVKLILCSPSFLYLREITDESQDRLSLYDLASRLSYAVWAAPPDDALLAAAADGSLADPGRLRAEIGRLLDDDRSEAFVSGFLQSWLNLRDIGNLPPPRQEAEVYYAEALPRSMTREAELFFSHLLQADGRILDLIDADYSFVDKKLAKLYRLPDWQSMRLDDGFTRVQFPPEANRGGVLGMAAVLTVSANGVETSPVTRGVWVLENILGVTPPPPPDEVPEIEADVSGAKTIREKLAAHSADPACSVCHRQIDPLGYALESFDPIGRWRTTYPKPKRQKKALPIDPTGTLLSGERYDGFGEFRKTIAAVHGERFTRHLIDRLLSYATGRHMERLDRYAIDDIRERVRDRGDGLRAMVVEVLASDVVRSR